ncbi:MAG: ketoacyl-ACP synthase III [Candidatus Caldatribacterium sp.]|nr:ketoacyl-ACP synthase III [Candidatus Caldatribacterium sp.]
MRILGTGSSVPEKVLTNLDLERMVDTSDEWITTRTGIKERRIALPSETTSTFALEASWRALRSASVAPEELDCIIVATVTPDMLFPSTACILQHALGAKNAFAFDLEAGCTGFVYALSVAEKYLLAEGKGKALVVGAETLSKIVDWQDRATCVLFGDGAGAVVLGLDERPGILATYLGADGGGAHLLELPAGGSRMPASFETVEKRLHYIKMNGNEVFKFAVRVVEEASRKVLEKAQKTIDDVSLFIPHQANIRIIQSAAKRLGIPEEKIFVNVDRYGNTSAASVPIALDEALRSQRIGKGDIVLLVGFGAGLTWGAALIEW